MDNRILLGIVGSLVAASVAASATPPRDTVKNTENALIGQMKCSDAPHVSAAINAMLKNRVIRYVADESGVYLFAPTVPLKFLDFPVSYISASDNNEGFLGVPDSRMVGTARPDFLEIDVVAPKSALKRRALSAGLIEALPNEGKRGFDLDPLGLYLAGKNTTTISSVVCAGQ